MKKIFIALLIFTLCLFSSYISTKRSHTGESPSQWLDNHRKNGNIEASKNPRVNLRFVKGVIYKFLRVLGLSEKEVHSALRISLSNHSRIMYILKDLVRHILPSSSVHLIGKHLNSNFRNFSRFTHNQIKRRSAIKAISQYFHPTRTVAARKRIHRSNTI